MAALAHWEREEIASRVAASVPIRAKLGKPLGGPAPLGYQWKEKKLVPDPAEVPLRRLVHELFIRHRRMKSVANDLNKAGHRTRKGKLFHANAIDFLLRDSTPKGLHRANYVTYDPKTRRWVPKPESEWVYNEVEPILEAEVWEACAAILRERDEGRKPRAKHPVQLFAGLLVCHCGGTMYVPSNTPKYVCKACRNKIAIQDLEDIFLEQIESYLLSATEIRDYMRAKNRDLAAKQELLAAIEREERNLRAEMEKVYRLYVTDQITPEGFGGRYKPMEERLRQIGEERPRTAAAIDFLRINLASEDQIFTDARNLAAFWPEMTREARRRIVESLVSRITLGNGEIDFDLFYLPSAPTGDPGGDDGDDDDDNPEPGGMEEPPHTETPPTPRKTKADTFGENMAKRLGAMEDTEKKRRRTTAKRQVKTGSEKGGFRQPIRAKTVWRTLLSLEFSFSDLPSLGGLAVGLPPGPQGRHFRE